MTFNFSLKATIEKSAVINGTSVNKVPVFNDDVVFNDSKSPIKNAE